MIKKIFYLFTFLIAGSGLFGQIDSTKIKTSNVDSSDVISNLKDTANSNYNIPIFSTTGADAESDLDQQDASSLLQSSRDVFTQFASFQFGAARYRMRGYPAENQQVMVNGVNMNNLETGFSSWSNWGGLNDVTRYTENRFGVFANRYGFSGPGGYTNIDSKASSFKKGTRLSYANANRIFGNRFMLTHSTGLLNNGWAMTLSASNRNGDQVYIPGTYFNASAYYLSVDKHINDKHILSFTGFYAPIEQGRASAEVLEAYQLANNNYYNSLWGYQKGKVRNSTVSRFERPMLMMTHVFQNNTSTKLTSTIYYNFGKSGLTSLNWNNSTNPRPDYYRYLPSFYYDTGDTIDGNALKNKWATDINHRQINWDKLIAMNQANLYVLPSQLGQGINTTETRSRYVLENRVEDLKNIGINTVYNKRVKHFFLSVGLNANIYKNRKYKLMEDLLGGTYWLDYDQFAQNLGVDPSIQQNNIDKPDNKIYKGQKFGYDYMININHAEIWTQGEYSLNKVDAYLALTISGTQVWREGYWANGKFPTTSKGKSNTFNFLNSGIKGGITYKITGRHFLTLNSTFLTRSPEVNNIFISPRVRNDQVIGVQNEEVFSGDINYQAKFPGFKLRVTGYFTQINNQTWLRSYWHDAYNNNVNLIMKNVNQAHQGLEIGLEKTLFTSHVIQAALGAGQFIYTNRPTLEAWQDNNAASLFTNRTVYLKNYRVGGSPQFVSGIGYKYNAKKHWFAGVYFNYFDEIYLEPNPDRRTKEALTKYLENEEEVYNTVIEQEKLPSYSTVNLTAGKSFRILSKYYLNFNLSVNNIQNKKNNLTGGFEQMRWDQGNIGKFDNKYFYMPGATYMAMVNFNF
jgi:hypothetical protein